MGPRGLLTIVETALGIRSPAQPQAVRLARWRAKLAAADGPLRFWHASFALDPLATAQAVLSMRDALVEAGWHAEAISSPPQRLADIAAAETSGPSLLPGMPDRLRDVLREIAAAPPQESIAASLTLLDDRPLLPPGIGELVSALEASGTRIVQAGPPAVRACGDLGAVQARLSGGVAVPLQGDGTFALMRANTEGMAAEVLADWLAALSDRNGVVVIAQRPTGILDAALRRRHLPRLGVSTASPLRGLIQMLPLALATRWQPFDAVRMLDLLQMPHSPVPGDVRFRLARVLPECPGRGGLEWNDAIADGLAARADRLRTQDPNGAAVWIKAGEEAVRIWLQAPLADPESGIQVADLAALCSALTAWATRMAARDVPLAKSLVNYTSTLLTAVQESGMEVIPRLGLERLLDTVLADGETDPTAPSEASEWSCVESPGSAWGKHHTVVWWGFDPPPAPARFPWDVAETLALATAACTPWSPYAALSAASASWRRPLLGATNRALLIAIPGPDGNLHPLAHEIVPQIGQSPATCPTAEELLGGADLALAGTVIQLVPAEARDLPKPSAVWNVPVGLTLSRDTYSATSIESLLGCPFAWVLAGDAGIRAGRSAEIADGERLIGQLAHRLAAELFQRGGIRDPQEIKNAAAERLPALVEEAAAPLLQPGAAAERARMSERLPIAMQRIAGLLSSSGLAVVGAEVARGAQDMPEVGERFEGRVDLLLEDEDGRPAVLDLKWTRRAATYTGLLQDGAAIQLAAYARLVGAGERAAFFLLRDGEAFSTPLSGLGTPSAATAPTLVDTWERAIASRRLRLTTVRNGTLRALGVDYDQRNPGLDPDGVTLRPPPPCMFCAFGRLCGKTVVT